MRSVFLIVSLFLFSTLFSGCTPERKSPEENAAAQAEENQEEPSQDAFGALYEQAARIAAGLDSRQLAAQLILAGIDGKGHLTRDMQTLLGGCPAGGVMLFRYNLDTPAEEIQNLVAEVSALIAAGAAVSVPGFDEFGCESGQTVSILPFVAVDHEGGQVVRFRRGVADLPAPAHYKTLADDSQPEELMALIEADNFRAGAEIASLGITMNFAPLAEFLNAHNTAFLGSRSYGDDPVFVAEAAAACVQGMEAAGLLCAIKHFPGSAGKDPHLFSSVINAGEEELDYLISPFASLIRGGKARAIMVSHTLVPARDPARIASLSPTVMNDWLRCELGFTGIVICDDFSMAAALRPAAAESAGALSGIVPADHIAAAVNSLAAGADMVMVWPRDIRRTHRAIQDALANGGLSPERLREAASRIIFEKIRMGLLNDG
jgi:beta-N-acetylhexosaminidase